MLLPRFSTRVILVVMAVCAVYFLTVGLALRGSIWAMGVAVAATSLVFLALVHAAFFGICYWIGRIFMKPKPARGRAVPGAVVAALLFSLPISASAGTGEVITLPPPRVKAPSGLQLTVDTTWVESYGYLPVQVTVTSPKPAAADQTITFRFKAGNWQLGQQPLIAVDQDIELEEGQTTASATVLVPKLQEWQFVWWDVLVDGDFEKELSVDRNSRGWVNQMGGGLAGGDVPRVLVVANEGQQVNISAAAASASSYGYNYTVNSFGGSVVTATVPPNSQDSANQNGTVNIAGLYFAAQRPVGNLPTNWLAYTALDQLVLTAEQLEQIQVVNPRAWTAIERWVRAGGNLWLCDLGGEWEDLPATLGRLGTLVEKSEEGAVGWYAPFAGQNVTVSSAFTREATAQERAGELPEGAHFAWRPAGMGALLISRKPFEQLDQEWIWMQQQEGQHLGWVARHGTAPSAPNASFANLLIPGVGLAPVTEFRILITLFVVLIGPVNYWFLRRCGRLHLLILSVPLAAALVTVALFAYAIIGDGLGTRLRVRSFTALDQQTRETATWARTSYYAGLAPSGGLEFPSDTAIYPINPGSMEMSTFGSYGGNIQPTPRAVQWHDKQYLTEGWLASRTLTQYLTVAARRSEKQLEIARKADSLQVVNRLGAAVDLLVVRDKDGTLFLGDAIEPGGSAALAAVDEESEVASRLRKLFQDQEPVFPEGFDAQYRGIAARQYRDVYNSIDPYGGYAGPAANSRLEQRIDSFTQPLGSATGRSVNLPSGSYLALTERGIEVATGLGEQDEEDSFHVVHGTW